MYKYIFFDLDGTLTDSGEGIIRSLEYAFDELGLERPDSETIMKFIGPPLVVSFRDFMNYDEETTQKAIAKYRERYVVKGIFENYPYEGIPELLGELKNKGFRLAVATTKPEYMAERVTDHYDLTKYFDAVSGAVGENDSKEAVIRRACERMGIDENEFSSVLMVGDRCFDIDGAAGAGVDSCGAIWGYGNEEEFREHNATYIVYKTTDVYELAANSAK